MESQTPSPSTAAQTAPVAASPVYVFSCGHPVPQARVKGPQTAAWAAERLCPSCWGQEQRKQAAEAAEKEAADLGLAPLTGSDKQRVWAEPLRLAWIEAEVAKIVAQAKAHPDSAYWIGLDGESK